jgi:hypothetical protein
LAAADSADSAVAVVDSAAAVLQGDGEWNAECRMSNHRYKKSNILVINLEY